jgi:hypothetical protein
VPPRPFVKIPDHDMQERNLLIVDAHPGVFLIFENGYDVNNLLASAFQTTLYLHNEPDSFFCTSMGGTCDEKKFGSSSVGTFPFNLTDQDLETEQR